MKKDFISVILLAGGLGTRMKSALPKHLLPLNQKPIVLYSFEVFRRLPEISEIVVVCDSASYSFFPQEKNVKFASPGQRRQDSVYNGLMQVDPRAELICIHDAARPLLSADVVRRCLQAGIAHGAATVGMPVKFTVKESREGNFVKNTLDRSALWEIQTPQVIKKELLEKGFSIADERNLTVNDDVSLVEHLGHPVKIVEGSYANLKITTQEDLPIAERLLVEHLHGKFTL